MSVVAFRRGRSLTMDGPVALRVAERERFISVTVALLDGMSARLSTYYVFLWMGVD